MTTDPDRLYRLLPGIIRLRDAEQGYGLRDLLRVLGEQADLLEEDIRRMYANLFIETCEDWVVPYIGDLVGYRRRPVPGEESGRSDDGNRSKVLVPRRAVADTIKLRRRKGTYSVLDDLVAAVAGWPASISDTSDPAGEVTVNVWRLPSWPLTKVRPFLLPRRTNSFALSVLGNDLPLYEPTDSWEGNDPASTRPLIPNPIKIATLEGNYGVGKSVCLFENGIPIPANRIKAHDLKDWKEGSGEQIAVDPERGRVMFPERARIGEITASYYYGFAAALGGGEYRRPQPAPPVSSFLFGTGHLTGDGSVLHGILTNDDGGFTVFLRGLFTPGILAGQPQEQPPPELRTEQKPLERSLSAELNRILQAFDLSEGPLDMDSLDDETLRLINTRPGGAGRLRPNRLILEARYPDAIRRAFALVKVSARGRQPVIMDAIRDLQESPRPPVHVVVELTDSGLYVQPVTVNVPAHHTFELRAADGCRPTIVLPAQKADIDDMVIACGDRSRVELDGIMISSHAVRVTGHPADVIIRHCTFVPGWELDSVCKPRNGDEPSLVLSDIPVREEDKDAASQRPLGVPLTTCVHIDHSITGTIIVQRDEVDTEPVRLFISDSIVDATDSALRAIAAPNDRKAHALLNVRATTVIGRADVHAIELAENSIFTGDIQVGRRQIGCIRYSYVPPGSRTPRRHACQPDLVIAAAPKADQDAEAARVKPLFMDADLRYGRHDYCRLDDECAPEIREGADDESEMGVFHSLFESQREVNLSSAITEFLPMGWNHKTKFRT